MEIKMDRKNTLYFCIGIALLIIAGNAVAKEENLAFSGIETLFVEGSFFSVTVTGYSGETVEARIIIPDRFFKDGIQVLHKHVNSELRFWVEKEFLSGIKIPFGESSAMHFKVPYDCEVEIRNSSGNVRVEGIRSKEMQVQTSSGDMEIKKCSANFELSSSSGDIFVKDCHGKKDLHASSGDIIVHKAEGDIKAKTSSGRQDYDEIKGDISAQSSSGDLYIANHGGGLNLESSSGRQTGRNIHISKNSSFRTNSGKIDFDFINEIEDFNFDLTSTSGKIQVGLTKAKGRVVTGNGKILIKGKSSSGGQVYR